MAAETGSATITVLVATADEEYADRITTNLTGHGDYAVNNPSLLRSGR